MFRVILTAASILLLCGCSSLGIMFGPKVNPSDFTYDRTIALPYENDAPSFFGADYDSKICTNKPTPLVPAGMPIAVATVLGAIGGVVIDSTNKAITDKVESIKNDASKIWTSDWVTNTKDIKETTCIALIRYQPSDSKDQKTEINIDQVQMAILLRVTRFGNDAFQLSPVYVFSKQSMALTKCESHCVSDAQGKISLAIAMTQTYQKSTGEIAEGGNTTLTVGNIAVNEGKQLNQTPINNKINTSTTIASPSLTKPTPFITPDTTPVYVKFAVSESGTLSGADHATAEMKALTEALGPIAKDLLKKKLDKLSSENTN